MQIIGTRDLGVSAKVAIRRGSALGSNLENLEAIAATDAPVLPPVLSVLGGALEPEQQKGIRCRHGGPGEFTE